MENFSFKLDEIVKYLLAPFAIIMWFIFRQIYRMTKDKMDKLTGDVALLQRDLDRVLIHVEKSMVQIDEMETQLLNITEKLHKVKEELARHDVYISELIKK